MAVFNIKWYLPKCNKNVMCALYTIYDIVLYQSGQNQFPLSIAL